MGGPTTEQIVAWLKTDKGYARNIVRLAGLRVSDDKQEGIHFDVMGTWDGQHWIAPYFYSLPLRPGRISWYTSEPSRLFNRSLGDLSETFREMMVPKNVIGFAGYLRDDNKQIYFDEFTFMPISMDLDAAKPGNEKIWLREKLWDSTRLAEAVKELQKARRHLKGLGF
jgi:hypothetical protein